MIIRCKEKIRKQIISINFNIKIKWDIPWRKNDNKSVVVYSCLGIQFSIYKI